MAQMLLTEREVCETLSLSRATLRRLMARGHVRAVRVGRAVRFLPDELERFVKGLAEEANATDEE